MQSVGMQELSLLVVEYKEKLAKTKLQYEMYHKRGKTPDALEDTTSNSCYLYLRLDEWVVYTFALTKWYYDIVTTVVDKCGNGCFVPEIVTKLLIKWR